MATKKKQSDELRLNCDTVEITARRIDDLEAVAHDAREGEREWFWESQICEECGAHENASSESMFFRHQEHDTGDCTACEEGLACKFADCPRRVREIEEHAEGPMMNAFWPCPWAGDGFAVAEAIAHLNLVPVEIGSERGLMFTGGGMDFSWEIAEAYVVLGFYPPASLDLPMDCRDLSGPKGERYRGIVQALATSYRILAGWCTQREERLRGVVVRLKEHAKDRKVRERIAKKKHATRPAVRP